MRQLDREYRLEEEVKEDLRAANEGMTAFMQTRRNRQNKLYEELERSRQMVTQLPELTGDNESLRR